MVIGDEFFAVSLETRTVPGPIHPPGAGKFGCGLRGREFDRLVRDACQGTEIQEVA